MAALKTNGVGKEEETDRIVVTTYEVQVAHDVVAAVDNGEYPQVLEGMNELDKAHVAGARSVLCWLFGHGGSFGENIDAILEIVGEDGNLSK